MKRSIRDVISFIVDNRGKNPPYTTSEGIPIIDNYLIANNYYPNLLNVNRYIDDYLLDNFIRDKSIKDDVLITLVGNGLGNVCLHPDKAVIIQNTIGLRCNNLMLQKYLYYSLIMHNSEIKGLNRGASQPSAKVSDLLDIKIDVPNIETQRHIVNTIGSVDDLIEKYQAQINKMCSLLELSLKQYEQSIEISHYRPKIIKSGINPFKGNKEYIDTSSVDGVNNLVSGEYIAYEKRPSRANMQPVPNSVWFAKMKESKKKLVLTEEDNDIIETVILSTGFQGVEATEEFPLSLIAAIVISNDFDIQRDIHSVGTTMAGINNETFSQIKVPLLSPDEIRNYDKKYSGFIKLLSLRRKQIDKLKATKQQLLQKYF